MAKPRLVQNWLARLKDDEALPVGPPCTCTISGGFSPAGAVKSPLAGG